MKIRRAGLTTALGWIPCAAALLCAAVVIYIDYYPLGGITSYAASDDAWQGTVKVVEKSDDEHTRPYGSGKEVVRFHWAQTATYSGFRLQEESGDSDLATISAVGSATVNLTFDETNYRNQTGSTYSSGKDVTATGNTVLPGKVRFIFPKPKKTAGCSFFAGGAQDGQVWQVWEIGRVWYKNIPPLADDFDRPVRQALELNMSTAQAGFPCDPNGTTFSGQKDLREMGDPYHRLVTWYLSRGPSDSEAVIFPPDNYATWMPAAGADEDTPGNTINVHVHLHKKGQPTQSSSHTAKFRFQLVQVSKEKGVCLNWPSKKNAKDSFDLKIQKEANSTLQVAADGQSAESQDGLKESQITITSYDWGAYGGLKVTAIYDDGHQEDAHVEGATWKSAAAVGGLSIPLDENGNHIADAWERGYPGSSSATADEDEVPTGDRHTGDGLSRYEEYRGFRVHGVHIQTNPAIKDIFIRDQDNLGQGYFAQSGLAIHLIDDGEFSNEATGTTNTMVINGNRGFATLGPQHALRLVNKNLPGLYGKAFGGPGVPKKIEMVAVDRAGCLEIGPQELSSTIAHELAHACNVWHHGATDYKISSLWQLEPDGEWTPSEIPAGETYKVAAQGGQESGIEECIMRYDSASLYENAAGNLLWGNPERHWTRGFDYPPYVAPGNIFCDRPEGTGVNAPGRTGGSKAGNATKGKCSSQFCVNDTKH